MAKELEVAGQLATADAGGAFTIYKEAVYNYLGKLFSWLSTHQGIALIIILVLLVILIYLFIRYRKYSSRVEKDLAGKTKEIGKKDALIEEQKNKIGALQTKLSDQQTVASESMLRTIRTLTGYNSDQLKTFFKSLTEISANPLQIADPQTNTVPDERQPGEAGDDFAEDDSGNEQTVPAAGPEKAVEADKSEPEAPGKEKI